MKFKNTFLSLLRHALTTVGGALSISPEPQTQAIGLVLVALGGVWGAKDEHAAENPGGKAGGSPLVPLLVFALIGAVASIGFTGCASSPGAPIDLAKVERGTKSAVKIAAVVVLQNEPGAAAELRRISAGADSVFVTGELTPEQLRGFLDALKVRPENRLLIAAAIEEARLHIVELTGNTTLNPSSPVVAAALRGTIAGIDEALALQAAVQPAAAQ